MFSDKPYLTALLRLLLAMTLVVKVYAQEETEAGAFIVVSKEGEVQVLDANDQVLPDEESSAGKTLLEGQTIKTGPSGRIIILLSTGTLTTVEESSQFLLDQFRQKPFEQDADTSLADLAAEPSTSEVKLKLGYGSVVFNVKKLNPGSSFEIDSPVGTSGVRGTDGQLEVTVDPNTGNFSGGVNMLSGSVNFRSVSGLNFNVLAGQSIFSQVTPTGQMIGQLVQRPVPPNVTQRLNQRTNLAKDSSRDVKVGQINQARRETIQKIKSNPRRQENKGGGQKGERNAPKSNLKNGGATKSTRTDKVNKVKTAITSKLKREQSNTESREQLMEVDDQADLAQQGIELSKDDAKALRAMGLNQDDLKELRKLDKSELLTLMQAENAEQQQVNIRNQIINTAIAEKIQSYENQERVIIEQFSNLIQFQLLSKLQPGNLSVLLENISPESLSTILPIFANSNRTILQLITFVQNSDTESLIAMGVPLEELDTVPNLSEEIDLIPELLELLSDNSNEDILEDLLEMGDGSLDEALFELGVQTNELLSDMEPSGSLSADRIFAIGELEENPFYNEPVFLAHSFFEDTNLSPVLAYVSRNVSINTSLDLSEIYQAQQKARFMITAKESIHLEGDVEISTGGVPQETYLSLLAGESLNLASNTNLNFTGDHLHLGSWGSMEMVNVSMESGKSIEVQTLEDLVIRNSSLRVRSGDVIHLQAANALQLNSVNFSNNLQEIYMQATTIDLRNINFPDGSTVNLATFLGGIDGKYPTFPTGDPQNLNGNRQIGRVNFIQNVQYNQNMLNNRAQFDQFGQNIHISTIQP